jgi:hypothetical protein
MTKARLQLEASFDTHEPEGRRDLSADNRRASPLDFDSLPEPSERAMSRDSASRTNHIGLDQATASDSFRSIPSHVHVNQGSRETNSGRQPQVSPLPPGFLNSAFVGQAWPSVDTTGQQKVPGSVRDWETASSASQQSAVLSENLGSDSALSSGFASGVNTPSESLPVPRSRSYTYPAVLQPGARDLMFNEEKTSPSTASPGSGYPYFVPAVGTNRRRACTMSPKQGSIQEDRPHFSGDALAMPSFSSVDHSTFPMRSRKNSYSPVLSQLGLEKPSSGESTALFDGTNRPRASSATSLPQSFPTGEEYPLENSSSFSQHSTSPLLNPLGAGSRARARSEDVYRERQEFASGNLPVLPGFSSGNDVSASSGFHYNPAFSRIETVDNIGNAPAGSNAAAASASDIFSSIGIGAHDMGSILKMSGAGDRPDRERSNTYPNVSQTSTEAFFTENFFGRG